MRYYGKWLVKIPGEEYVWDPDDMTIGEALMVENELDGLPLRKWLTAIDAREAAPCQVLIWFLRMKAGKPEERFAVDFPLLQLETHPLADEGEPDPEAPAVSETASSSSSPETESHLPNSTGSLAATS